MADAFVDALRSRIRGTVLSESADLQKFARDQSIYEVRPLAVVIPADCEDIATALQMARDEGVTVHPRGGGSGTAGAALGRGIVIAPEKDGPLGKIEQPVDSPEGLFIRVGAATVHDTLQTYLREQGLTLPADPSSGLISLIGGNVATRSSGANSLKWGAIDQFLYGLEFFLPDGQLVNTADPCSIPTALQRSLEELSVELAIMPELTDKIHVRRGMKSVSGYNLTALLEEQMMGVKLARLLAGSVGTLGLITAVTLQVVPRTDERCLIMIPFSNLGEVADAVCWLNKTGATAVELISADTLAALRARRGGTLPCPDDAHLLFIELEGPERHQQLEQIQRFFRHDSYPLSHRPVIVRDDAEIDRLWSIRKRLLPMLSKLAPHLAFLPVANDVAVPPTCLAALVERLERMFKKRAMPVMIYGHAGNGNLHIRPLFDLRSKNLPCLIETVAEQVYEVVLGLGGTITAEHGMGRLRSPWLEKEWGAPVVQRMRRVKEMFDPDWLLNPDAMFNQGPIGTDLRSELRGD